MKRLNRITATVEKTSIPNYVKSDKIYHQYPIKVTRRFRDGLIQACPALEEHQRAKAYRAMLEYILYATLRDDEGRLVFPAETLASLVGAKVGSNGFAALDYLQGFSGDIFPLTISDYIPHKKARCISCDLPEIISELTSHDETATFTQEIEKVWLVSGLPVTPSNRRTAKAQYEENIMYRIDNVEETHPAYPLQTRLNTQSQVALGKYIRKNWHRLLALHGDMEDGERKNSVGYILLALQDWQKNLYSGSNKTVRISTKGITIHSLPRAFRKAALTGAVEFDIRSSQSAIVAKLWELPQMSEVLASEPSFWSLMLEHLALNENAKSALKTALYATCFGMGKQKLVRSLSAEIGRDKAICFFKHPLMVEILRGRSVAMKKVKANGGIEDAFGRWIALGHDFPAHALLAIEAQSWELRLMLPIFEVIKGVEDLSILSWLHDGVVIHYSASEDIRRRLNGRVIEAFNTHAKNLGFPTNLEPMYL